MASKCRLWNFFRRVTCCWWKGHDWRFVKQGKKGRYVYECERCDKKETRE